MPRFQFLIATLTLLIISGFCSIAFSQSRTTSQLTGLVEDEATDTPLPSALIKIESANLIGGPRTINCDEQGRFRFLELPPGLYTITATLAGYKSVVLNGMRLSAGMTTDVSIDMTLYAGEETVIVEAEPKEIDSTSAAQPTTLPQEYLKNIPNDRDTSHILDLAPGINLESAFGSAEESGIAYQMDGVDISDPQGGAPWSFFNYSLIDEVELIGLGAPAEYGQFTGVVFNTITKSGGNEFSGSAEFYYSDKNLTATNSEFVGLFPTIEKHQDQSFQFGGPIKRDKLWYFLSAQYAKDLSSEGGPIETQKDPRVFFKSTFQANSKNTIEGWVEWDHTKVIGRDADAFTPLEATTGEDNPEVVGNVRWKSELSDHSVLSVAWGGYSGRRDFNPFSGFLTSGHFDAKTDLASVNARQFGKLNRTRNQLNASLTQIINNHVLKFGTEIEHSDVRDRYAFPGGKFFIDNEGPEEDPSTSEDDFFTLTYTGDGYDANGTNNRISLFAQDSWQITPGFTLNPGIRFDIDRGKVSDGSTVFKTQGLAPRIGFAWDLSELGHSVLKAHYGRYYEALFAAYYYYMDPGAFHPLTVTRTFNESGFTETILSNSGQQYAMDPNIKHPYLDQYILGFDQQVPYGIVLSSTFIYRKNKNFIETMSRDGIFVPVPGVIPGTGQQVTLFDYLNPSTDVLVYTNPAGLNRTYHGFMVTASRRFRNNWQMLTSYVYSKTRGNIDNLAFDEFGTGGNVPFFDGHFLDTPNSLINAQGRLTHDQNHQFKLQGTYILPSINLSLSANYTYHSGDTWTPRDDCLLTDDGNGVIGDGIFDCHEFPQGPVTYFAEPRGSRRLPARNEIDLRVGWEHNFAQQYELGLYVDIFNLTNQSRPTEVEPMIGEGFGEPANLNFPRNARLGVSFSW
ncbi:TonB-dependent receptor [bacterium]|nr:TonB-dependent receptor [bacterium]